MNLIDLIIADEILELGTLSEKKERKENGM